MEYKLKPINIDAKPGETPVLPLASERVIEMHGQVVEITLGDLANTQAQRAKLIKELKANMEFETAKIENIESFHPFVKELSEEDLHHAWMYFESKAMVKGCAKEIAKNEGYMQYDMTEIAEIKKQIPELSDAAQEVEKMLSAKVESTPAQEPAPTPLPMPAVKKPKK